MTAPRRRPDPLGRARLTVALELDLAPRVRLLFGAAPTPPGEHPDRRELTGGACALLALALAHTTAQQQGGQQ